MPTIVQTPNTLTTAQQECSRAPQAWKWAAWACGLGLVAIAVWFRLWRLDHVPGVNGDEAWYGVQVMSWLRGETVAWRTPTGNPMNPFYFFPLSGVHSLWGVGFWQLRSVAAASGLLALLVNFCLARRAFGLEIATISTIVLAVLPINLAYSRFGWDASQSLLFTLPVVYCPLVAVQTPKRAGRWLFAGTLSFFAAVLVHPTNVFLLPAVVAPSAVLYGAQLFELYKRFNSTSWRFVAYGAVIVVSGAVLFLLRHWFALASTRIISPSEFGQFLGRYVDLLSGVTIYQYIPGSLIAEDAWSWSVLSVGLLTLATWGVIGLSILGWRAQPLENRALVQGLLGGWLFTAVGFYLVAGPGALAPHFERYGICLIAPTVVVISLGLSRLIANTYVRKPLLNGALATVAACFLVSFYSLYLQPFTATGGQSHRAFRTAREEPKQMLVRQFSANASGTVESVTLATSEWWTYWPLKYLSMGVDGIDVEQWEGEDELAALIDRDDASHICFVEFVGQPSLENLRARLLQKERPFDESVLLDAAGYPLLAELALERKAHIPE